MTGTTKEIAIRPDAEANRPKVRAIYDAARRDQLSLSARMAAFRITEQYERKSTGNASLSF